MQTYEWAVIGAGPAGIATVGQLLDHGIKAQDIIWLDPYFAVGDFGRLWRNVPSNTKVSLFLKFLHAVQAFNYKNCPHDFALQHENPEATCRLGLAADALQWVTEQLKAQVNHLQDTVQDIISLPNARQIKTSTTLLTAKNIVLATGAEPKKLAFSSAVIPLQDAMDSERLFQHCKPEETIAVFGSSHSAVLVLRNLVESGCKKILNFYRTPLRYAVYMPGWILFDDTGLKGTTADWAHEHLDGKLPANLQRIHASDENIAQHLPQCDKVVYAVGFEKRMLPVQGLPDLNYIEECGIIAPGLFGVGIGFPEKKQNPLGIYELRVGLWKFMDYLQRIMPVWLQTNIIRNQEKSEQSK